MFHILPSGLPLFFFAIECFLITASTTWDRRVHCCDCLPGDQCMVTVSWVMLFGDDMLNDDIQLHTQVGGLIDQCPWINSSVPMLLPSVAIPCALGETYWYTWIGASIWNFSAPTKHLGPDPLYYTTLVILLLSATQNPLSPRWVFDSVFIIPFWRLTLQLSTALCLVAVSLPKLVCYMYL